MVYSKKFNHYESDVTTIESPYGFNKEVLNHSIDENGKNSFNSQVNYSLTPLGLIGVNVARKKLESILSKESAYQGIDPVKLSGSVKSACLSKFGDDSYDLDTLSDSIIKNYLLLEMNVPTISDVNGLPFKSKIASTYKSLVGDSLKIDNNELNKIVMCSVINSDYNKLKPLSALIADKYLSTKITGVYDKVKKSVCDKLVVSESLFPKLSELTLDGDFSANVKSIYEVALNFSRNMIIDDFSSSDYSSFVDADFIVKKLFALKKPVSYDEMINSLDDVIALLSPLMNNASDNLNFSVAAFNINSYLSNVIDSDVDYLSEQIDSIVSIAGGEFEGVITGVNNFLESENLCKLPVGFLANAKSSFAESVSEGYGRTVEQISANLYNTIESNNLDNICAVNAEFNALGVNDDKRKKAFSELSDIFNGMKKEDSYLLSDERYC